MITLQQINKAINDTIKGALSCTNFSDVLIKSEDIQEALKKSADGSINSEIRPSIKVKLEQSKIEKFNSRNKERTLTVRVYFFAKDRYKYKNDNMKMQDILENAFLEDIKVTDTFYMPILEDGVDFSVTDSVLQCSFDLYSVELISEEPGEPMEELKLDFNLHEIKD
ncbi:hypothetical protein CLPUN_09740 [Clostridium puniceum]|uniref:Uncharacterized protein n=1 Tax=Clostridium puniceum TaxID=29367 RepID=A0A1S8TVN7_9CLOT|nr:hypothetical protein [Clostridium puniceum]OOM81790.1 hypothetical protein CLPUN_09740 [Clostridium puniceum]